MGSVFEPAHSQVVPVVCETMTFLLLLSVQPLSGLVSPFAEMAEVALRKIWGETVSVMTLARS